MENFQGEYYIGDYADFVLESATPILLSNLSVFYIQESLPASITGTNGEDSFSANCCNSGLDGTSITFQAESNAPVQIVFTGVFLTAEDIATYINAYNSGAAAAGGWTAVAANGYVSIESLLDGSLSSLQSLEANTILGFDISTAPVAGTDQEKVVVSGLNFQLLSLAINLYAVTFFVDGSKFNIGETYFLMANVSPVVIQHFDVLSGSDQSVSVNFLS